MQFTSGRPQTRATLPSAISRNSLHTTRRASSAAVLTWPSSIPSKPPTLPFRLNANKLPASLPCLPIRLGVDLAGIGGRAGSSSGLEELDVADLPPVDLTEAVDFLGICGPLLGEANGREGDAGSLYRLKGFFSAGYAVDVRLGNGGAD